MSSLGIPHETNLELAQGLLVIDVAITSHKLALMLSPDTQFCSNVSTQPLGSTMLEWRLLAMQGWQVSLVSTRSYLHRGHFALLPMLDHTTLSEANSILSVTCFPLDSSLVQDT